MLRILVRLCGPVTEAGLTAGGVTLAAEARGRWFVVHPHDDHALEKPISIGEWKGFGRIAYSHNSRSISFG